MKCSVNFLKPLWVEVFQISWQLNLKSFLTSKDFVLLWGLIIVSKAVVCGKKLCSEALIWASSHKLQWCGLSALFNFFLAEWSQLKPIYFELHRIQMKQKSVLLKIRLLLALFPASAQKNLELVYHYFLNKCSWKDFTIFLKGLETTVNGTSAKFNSQVFEVYNYKQESRCSSNKGTD